MLIPDFCCECSFDPCCQQLDRDFYRFVGRTSLRQGIHFATYEMDQWLWFKQYQVSDYEPRRVGDWAVEKFEITIPGANAHNFEEIDPGRRVFPGNFTSLVYYGDPEFPEGQLVMSDTPSEISDHLEFIDKAHGRVLINGLGIGMVAHALLREDKRECIEHIDIVEYNKEVIDLVAHYFKDEPKVTIHHANAFEIEWPEDAYWHCAWHDIWYEINPDDVEQHRKLFRKYRGRVKWQDAWMHKWMIGLLWWERQKEKDAALGILN